MITFNETENAEKYIIQCLHDIQSTRSTDELIDKWKIHFHAFGFDHLVYNIFSGFSAHQTNPFKKTYTSNVTDEMRNAYFKGTAPFDPLLRYTCATMNSMWLSDASQFTYFHEEHPARFLNISLQLSEDGLAVPLIGPNFIKGYFFLGYAKGLKPNQRLFAKGSLMNWQIIGLCYFIHTMYCKLHMAMGIKIELTNREMDVLQLVIAGKTNREIGAHLGISTNTVNSYLKNLFMKMNTKDRVTTAIKAYSLNLIAAPQNIPPAQHMSNHEDLSNAQIA